MPLPNQLLTMAEKSVRNQETSLTNIEETIVHYIDSCGWQQEYDEINKLYAAAEGVIDYSEYKTIFGSTNQDSGANLDFMYKAKLENHNILMGIVKLLLGEFGTRSHEYETISLSPDDDISKKEGLTMLLKEYHRAKVLRDFNEITGMTSSEEEPLPQLDALVENYNTTFTDASVIRGQEALDFIKSYCDIDHKILDAFYDWVVTGGCFTYKDVINGQVVYEVVPRNELFVLNMKPGSRFVEDAAVHIRRRIMTPFQLLEMLQGEVEEKELEAFEAEVNNGYNEYNQKYATTGTNGAMLPQSSYVDSNVPLASYTDGIETFHVVYTSYKDVYFLSYIDEFGIPQEREVTADYILQPELGDIGISQEWYPCKIQGYKVMDFFFKCSELEIDRADIDSKGNLKSLYNGILERTKVGQINSIVKDGMVYQRTVNVLKFSMEKMINKNKGKVLVLPYGMVPRTKGISTAKQAYHMDATSVLWIDETTPNAAFASQMIKTVDMSLNGIIKELSDLVVQTKNEYWEAIGMNAQRYSDVSQYAGKATTEQAIVRSAIITYELIRQFDKMLEKDYNGLLDLSKIAWINGIKEGYIYSDGSRNIFEMNIDQANLHASSNFNVFVKDSSLNTRGIEALRNNAQAMVQNGASASMIPKLFTTNSTAKVGVLLEKMEKAQQMIAEQANQSEHERQMQLQELVNELEAAKNDLKTYEIDKRLEGVKYTADANLAGKQSGETVVTNEPDEVEDKSFDEGIKLREQTRKEKMDAHTVKKDNKELVLKEKAINKKSVTK